MNPIDKLQKCDFTEVFMEQDVNNAYPTNIDLYAIFSDDGQSWMLDTLTGVEVTAHGLLFRRKNTLQYKHCRLIKYHNGIKVIARVDDEACDCFIIGEHDDRFIVITAERGGRMCSIAKTDIITTGDEE